MLNKKNKMYFIKFITLEIEIKVIKWQIHRQYIKGKIK